MSAHDADPLLTSEAEDDLGLENPYSRRYLYAPMSYDETLTDMRPRWSPLYWYDVARRNRHVLDVFRPPDAVFGAFGKVNRGMRALWPQNRAQQAILIMMVLWVFVTYAEWTVEMLFPSRMFAFEPYWSPLGHYAHMLHGVKLNPLPGDGIVVENATWSREHCWSTGRPLREPSAIRCIKWANFYVDAMPDVQSLKTTDHAFLFIDPPRTGPQEPIDFGNNTQPHGAVPARVFFVAAPPNSELPDAHKGMIGVNVTAVYDKSAVPLVDTSLVARLAQGRYTSGVEILTPDIQIQDVFNHKHDSVRFDVVVSVPADQAMDGFALDATAAEVHTFDEFAYEYVAHTDATQLAGSQDRQREIVFGKLNLATQKGSATLGSSLRALGTILVTSKNVGVSLHGNLSAPVVTIQSEHGDVRLHSKSSIHGGMETAIKLESGSIFVDKGAELWGTALSFATERGSVLGDGTWFVNHTLALHSEAGTISAAIGVDKPDMYYITYEDQKKLGEGRLLSVDISTVNGSIDANYVQHLATMPLRSVVKTRRGSARVRHAREFEGKISARGNSARQRHADVAGRTVTSAAERHGATQVLSGSVSWDPALRPKLPLERTMPWDNTKTATELGAESVVESDSGAVELVFA